MSVTAAVGIQLPERYVGVHWEAGILELHVIVAVPWLLGRPWATMELLTNLGGPPPVWQNCRTSSYVVAGPETMGTSQYVASQLRVRLMVMESVAGGTSFAVLLSNVADVAVPPLAFVDKMIVPAGIRLGVSESVTELKSSADVKSA